MEFRLPSFEIVVQLHDEIVLKESEGKAGLPHPEAIHSAIGRPMRYMHYEKQDCTIHTVCAVLIDSIARNHAFTDGNKRTALITMLYTYIINGVKLTYGWVMNERYEELVLWVVNEKPTIKEIRNRLEELSNQFKSKKLSSRIVTKTGRKKPA